MQVQLTLTIDDSDRALELIGLFYGDHRVAIVDVRVDNFDPRPKVAAADPLNRPIIDMRPRDLLPATDKRPAETAKARIHAQRKEADQFIARRAELEAERDLVNFDRDLRAKVNMQRHREAQQAMSVPCPHCGVGIDEVCRAPGSGKAHSGYAHVGRIRAQAVARHGGK